MRFYTPPNYRDPPTTSRTPSRLYVCSVGAMPFYLLEKDELYKAMVDLLLCDENKRKVVLGFRLFHMRYVV